MFHPVGSQPPTVYWRRRLLLVMSLVALVGLIVLTARVLLSDDAGGSAVGATSVGGTSAGGTSAASSPSSSSDTGASTSSHPARPSSSATPGGRPGAAGKSGSLSASPSPSPPPLKACTVSALGLSAAADRTRYSVGDQPVLSLLVTNRSATACVQDLADPQIVMRVYNGESRVWNSHDCKVIPGTDDRRLTGKSTVRVSITWTGLSSQRNCAGTRQRVGAGTYTLYASLAGREGAAAQFTIS